MTRISSASACASRVPRADSRAPTRRRFFREWEFLALAIVIAVIYGARLTTLPIRGEETRRAEVATEILRTGDWIVPREQGAPFLSRPPLGSYPIALLEIHLGSGSLLAVRLPSVVATWLMTLIVYGYSRRFLEPLGRWRPDSPSRRPGWCCNLVGSPKRMRCSRSLSADLCCYGIGDIQASGGGRGRGWLDTYSRRWEH